jgi:Anti-sigma-K factor rskA
MKRQLSDVELFRAQELLILRATEGLDASGKAELAELEVEDRDAFDLAAAAIQASTLDIVDDTPAGLDELIIARGVELVSNKALTAPAVPAVAAQLPERMEISLTSEPRHRPSRPWRPRLIATASLAAAAAAAAIVFATTRSPTPSSPSASDPRELRGDARRFTLTPMGEVVWSDEKQAGRVRFDALPANDPARQRYQLWVIDGDRDPKFPVDGGLFDSSGGALDVPFTVRLPIGSVRGFVVTLEEARGAVVSRRERVVAETR